MHINQLHISNIGQFLAFLSFFDISKVGLLKLENINIIDRQIFDILVGRPIGKGFKFLILGVIEFEPVQIVGFDEVEVVPVEQKHVDVLVHFIDFVDYIDQLFTLLLSQSGAVVLLQFLSQERQVVVYAGDVGGKDPIEICNDQVLVLEVSSEIEDELFDWEDGLYQIDENVHLFDYAVEVLRHFGLSLTFLIDIFVHAELPNVVVVQLDGHINPVSGGIVCVSIDPALTFWQPDFVIEDEVVAAGGVHNQEVQHHHVFQADDGVGRWVTGFCQDFKQSLLVAVVSAVKERQQPRFMQQIATLCVLQRDVQLRQEVAGRVPSQLSQQLQHIIIQFLHKQPLSSYR